MKDDKAIAVKRELQEIAEELIGAASRGGTKPITSTMAAALAAVSLARAAGMPEEEFRRFLAAAWHHAEEAAITSPDKFRGLTVRPARDEAGGPIGPALIAAARIVQASDFVDGEAPSAERLEDMGQRATEAARQATGQAYVATVRRIPERRGRGGYEIEVVLELAN